MSGQDHGRELRITHTAAEGTLIEGTERGDGTAALLTAGGWRWSRTLGCWYAPRTRDKPAPVALIERTVERMRAAGYQIHATVDDAQRTTAEIEADRVSRQDRRVGRLTAKADRLTDDAAAADNAARDLASRIPLGQPILAGHHSQTRMTRYAERVERSQRRAVTLAQVADEAATAARTASHTTGARYSPVTVAARIERLEAQIRAVDRVKGAELGQSDRERLAARSDRLRDELGYWQQVRADQVATGVVRNFGPDNISRGDHIQVGRQWYEVIRVNRKSVTVPSGYSWTTTVPYFKITGHRSALTSRVEPPVGR